MNNTKEKQRVVYDDVHEFMIKKATEFVLEEDSYSDMIEANSDEVEQHISDMALKMYNYALDNNTSDYMGIVFATYYDYDREIKVH